MDSARPGDGRAQPHARERARFHHRHRRWGLRRRRRPAPSAHSLLGLAIVLVPVAARNAVVGGGFFVTTSQFGPNFYIGNNPTADGTYASLRYGRGAPEYERQDATELAELALGRRLSPAEVSSYWTDGRWTSSRRSRARGSKLMAPQVRAASGTAPRWSTPKIRRRTPSGRCRCALTRSASAISASSCRSRCSA